MNLKTRFFTSFRRTEKINRRILAVFVGGFLIAAAGWIGWRAWRGGSGAGRGETSLLQRLHDERKPHDYYTCAMHPQVHEHKSGKCPICGMDLQKVQVNPNITSPKPAKDKMGMDFIPVYEEAGTPAAGEAGTVPGRGGVTLSLDQIQLGGIRTEEVGRRRLEREILTYGRIAYDPDLYHAQEEYISALGLIAATRSGSDPEEARRARQTLESARIRLKLLGLSEAQIRRLEKTKAPDSRLLLGSGEKGRVWIYGEVYETDLAFVRVGLPVSAETAALPGETFTGKISAVDPVLNPATRTVRIRAEVEDPAGRLRPEMYLDLKIYADLGEAPAVPESAILDTGSRRYVFVESAPGRFVPRPVRVGRSGKGYAEVLEGLTEGEKVAARGTFLLDSESQLRAGTGRAFYGGREAAGGKPEEQGEQKGPAMPPAHRH